MELVVIIFAGWLIRCLFPGSSGYGPDLAGFLAVLACIVLWIAVVCAWSYAVVGLLWAFELIGVTHPSSILFAFIAPIAVPMLIAGCLSARRDKSDELGVILAAC